MNITEFLLARIAEDAAVAAEADEGSLPVADPASWAVSVCYDEVWGPVGRADMDASRLLAECEAKRRIVEAYVDAYGANRDTMWGQETRVGLTVAVDALVAVYSDHPDFKPEWRLGDGA
ncbi:MAG TPA: DUF6221 family protein [Pedococcus sp.]|nr:DUF6221 family protein [Pedococcus sp.]